MESGVGKLKQYVLRLARGGITSDANLGRIDSASAASQWKLGMLVVDEAQAPEYIERNLENAQNDLERIYYGHHGRRIFKWHHYLAIYGRHLQDKKSLRPLRVLEIGVQNGGSLQMWRKYFGPAATIFGIDIDPICKGFEEDGCQIRIGDQSDPKFIAGVIDEMGGVDVIIDDGSHIASHQLATFQTAFPLLADGGLYIVEDLHTSYWDGWEGGLLRKGTFIEHIKAIVDQMHGWYFPNADPMGIKASVTGLHLYDSIAVIDKGAKERPYAVHVGD